MKFLKFIQSWLKRRYRIKYSKGLPHYRLLNLSKWGLMIGAIALAASLLLGSSSLSITLFRVGAVLLIVSAIVDGIIAFIRDNQHDFVHKDEGLFSKDSKAKESTEK